MPGTWQGQASPERPGSCSWSGDTVGAALPPQPAVEHQDPALLPGQQNIYFTYGRRLFFWAPPHLATVLTQLASQWLSPSNCHLVDPGPCVPLWS